ncbi:MAG: VTT domain-containing protein [Gammaproteobacteria bacterium]|nr:VTT domain-containing protein [Gammaproteobacteria bacterium]
MIRKYRNKIFVLLVLIALGIGLQLSGLIKPEQLISVARVYADQWWLMILLVLMQMLLFTFALAGSSFLWVAAALYSPLLASLILAAGAASGGITAYFFSQRLTEDWIAKVESSRVYSVLHKNDNFFTLLALRLMPAFPHAIINYSAGILKVNTTAFVVASFIGVGIKSYVFVTMIQQAASSGSVYDLLDPLVLAPLILVSAGLFAGVLIFNRNKP